MKWLKKLFCKLFGCKCGCQEGKECKCSEPVIVKADFVPVTSVSNKETVKKTKTKTTKKKVTKKTTKKAKK